MSEKDKKEKPTKMPEIPEMPEMPVMPEMPEHIPCPPQFTMMPAMQPCMPEHMLPCMPQHMFQSMPHCGQPQMQPFAMQMPHCTEQQLMQNQFAQQFSDSMGMYPWMWGAPGMGSGAGTAPVMGVDSGTGMWSGTGMGPGMGPGMSQGIGWMYPMLNPYNYIMRVRPVVDRGIKESEKSSMKHAMTEVALISYLMGMGYDYSTAHRLVESWEINEMFLNE